MIARAAVGRNDEPETAGATATRYDEPEVIR